MWKCIAKWACCFVRVAVLFLFIFCGEGKYVSAQTKGVPGLPIARHYPPQSYGAGSQNWQIIEDNRGFLYTANHFGLLEFDGNTWDLHRLEVQTSLKSVALGSEGRLYVGGSGIFGYFHPDSSGALRFFPLHILLPEPYQNFDEVWNIYPVGSEVFFCTHSSIFHYKGDNKIEVIEHPSGILYGYYCHYNLYVSGWEDGLLKLENGALKTVPGGDIFRHRTIREMLPMNKQDILIATQEGDLYVYDGEEFTTWNTEVRTKLQHSQILCVKRLRDGKLAIGTQNKGLFILDDQGTEMYHLDKDQGLSGHTVLDLLEDQLGNIWVGTRNGLSYIYLGAPFVLINEKTGVRGSGYAAIQFRDTLYVGTSNGVFKQMGKRFVEVQNAEGQVYSFSEQKGQLLLGHHNGPFVMDKGRFQPLSTVQGAWMYQSLGANSNYLIQGHYKGFSLLKWNGTDWQYEGPMKGFEESARLYHQDAEGAIWVSHGFKGVYKIHLDLAHKKVDRVQYYNKAQGFPSDALVNVFQVKNRLIFGTLKGPYRYLEKEDRFGPDSFFTPFLGSDQRLIAMEESVRGDIYFLREKDVGMLELQANGSYQLELAPFEWVSPLVSDDLENIFALNARNILITARDGFIHYDPSAFFQKRDSLHLFLREITEVSSGNKWYHGQALDKAQGVYSLSLPFDKRAVKVRVAAPAHEAVGSMQYRFQVEGLDKAWTPWTSQPTREINGLSIGKHKVWAEVRAGELTQRAEIAEITILAPWYGSSLARMVYVLIFLGLIAYLAGWVYRRFRSVERELVLDKERALAFKDREKLESDLSFKNQELASATMHLLAKNAFLQRLKDELESLKKKDKEQAGKLQLEIKKISHKIDQNLADEEEWERFSHHFSQVHGDFFSKLKQACPELTPQELKLCAYLRLNMTTKEIAQLLNISIRGVESSRYRLRKKLDLDSQVNLIDYMMEV